MSRNDHRNGGNASILSASHNTISLASCLGAGSGGGEASFRSKLKDAVDAYDAPPILAGSPTYEEVVSIYNEEMLDLENKERETIAYEIHGVPVQEPENAEVVKKTLLKFRASLKHAKKKNAYNLAKLMNPSYVHDENLHLMALRAGRFDPVEAAKRFVQYFELKLELFGLECLARPILFSDLDEIDRAALDAGYFQILSEKDQSGRAVVVLAQRYHRKHEIIRAKFRIAWYLMMKKVEQDQQVQQNGFVGIVYNVGLARPREYCISEQIRLGSRFMKSILVKYVSFHYCFDDERLKPALALFQFSFGKTIRMRFRCHCGSHLECHHFLLTFGVPMDSFSIGQDGLLRTSNHLEQISLLQAQDEVISARLSASGLIYPTRNDVLFGRGKIFISFPGNLYFKSIVEKNRYAYIRAEKHVKTLYANELVQHIQNEVHGRFLRQKESTPNEWEVVSDNVAHEKATHTFRTQSK